MAGTAHKKNSNELAFYNILSTVLLNALTLISSPLFSRMLGVKNYGFVSVYNSWVSIFIVLFSLQTRGTLAIARVHFEEKDYAPYQSSAITISVLATLTISTICFLFEGHILPLFGLNIWFFVLMMFHSFGQVCIEFLNTIFTYSFKARNNMLMSLFLAISSMAVSFILLTKWNPANNYGARILGMSCCYGIIGFLSLFYILKQGKTLFCYKYWKFCLPLCLPLIFHNIAGVILISCDRIMLSKMTGNNQVGIYALAFNFASILSAIWAALNNSWNPFFYDYYKNSEWPALKKSAYNYLNFFTCLTLGFLLLFPEVYRVFARSDYWDGTKVIPILAINAYVVFLYGFAANYELAEKRTDVMAVGSVIAAVANIFLNYFFITLWSFVGAAVATLLANMILLCIHMCFARKLAGDKWVYSARFFAFSITCTFTAVCMSYFFRDYWPVRWIAAVAVGLYMIKSVYKNKAIF